MQTTFAAFPILLISIIGLSRSPFAASVSRPLTVTATVVRSCGVSTSQAGNEQSVPDADQSETEQRGNSIVTLQCSRGTAQNVLIHVRRSSSNESVQPIRSREMIQQSHAIETVALIKLPIEIKRDESNARSSIPVKMSHVFPRARASVKEAFPTEYVLDIVTVDF